MRLKLVAPPPAKPIADSRSPGVASSSGITCASQDDDSDEEEVVYPRCVEAELDELFDAMRGPVVEASRFIDASEELCSIVRGSRWKWMTHDIQEQKVGCAIAALKACIAMHTADFHVYCNVTKTIDAFELLVMHWERSKFVEAL